MRLRPKLQPGATLSKEVFGGQTRFILVHPERNITAELNEASFYALSRFDGENSLESISEHLTVHFDVDKDKACKDLVELCHKLFNLGLLLSGYA
jgi:hypothetical protein